MNGELVLSNTTATLRNIWEETSFQLEQLQTNPVCVLSEQKLLQSRAAPSYVISFDPVRIISNNIQLHSTGWGLILLMCCLHCSATFQTNCFNPFAPVYRFSHHMVDGTCCGIAQYSIGCWQGAGLVCSSM